MSIGYSGFVIKDLQTLITEASESSTTLFGTNIDVSDSSPLGKINQTTCAELAIYWEKLNTTYLAAFLDSASGENLDKIVYPLGVTRKPAVRSTGVATFTGTEGITIPGSTVVKTDDDVPIEFATDTSLVMSDIVTNGEFTTDTIDWTVGNGAVLSSVSGGKDGNCIKVYCDDVAANPYAEQTISVEEYHSYDFSVFVKAGDAGTYNVDIYDESNSAYIYQSGDLTETVGDCIHRAIIESFTYVLFDTCKLVHVSAAITAADAGTSGNVAAGTIVAMSSPISGITDVINANATSGGAAKETDVGLRIRTKQSIGAGGKATLNAIVAQVLAVFVDIWKQRCSCIDRRWRRWKLSSHHWERCSR